MEDNVAEKIKKLKQEKNAVILAHYYTTGEIRQVADFTGDSLALSIEAARTDADVIVFAGVYFMAETAKILSPAKKVLIPDPEAGCSLARSCEPDKFRLFRQQHPDATVVSYVNTTAEIKAMTDICCTSTNALDVINSISADRPILFAPDRNLGSYLQKQTGRQNMILWDGACHVHEQFSLEGILALKKEHPGAKVLAHPECKQPVLMVADFVGSTAAILDFCTTDDSREYIVVTESGILHDMRAKYPDRTFIPAPPLDSTCGCNDCEYMKLVTLEKILRCLETETPEVVVEEPVRAAAEKSIRAMIAVK
jgi:quinolinate synthase